MKGALMSKKKKEKKNGEKKNPHFVMEVSILKWVDISMAKIVWDSVKTEEIWFKKKRYYVSSAKLLYHFFGASYYTYEKKVVS